MNVFQCCGEMPYNMKSALLAREKGARGASKILTLLGAEVTVYDRRTKGLLKQDLNKLRCICQCCFMGQFRNRSYCLLL